MPLCKACKADDHPHHEGQVTLTWGRSGIENVGHRTAACDCSVCVVLPFLPPAIPQRLPRGFDSL